MVILRQCTCSSNIGGYHGTYTDCTTHPGPSKQSRMGHLHATTSLSAHGSCPPGCIHRDGTVRNDGVNSCLCGETVCSSDTGMYCAEKVNTCSRMVHIVSSGRNQVSASAQTLDGLHQCRRVQHSESFCTVAHKAHTLTLHVKRLAGISSNSREDSAESR